jgi:hypothetical protein
MATLMAPGGNAPALQTAPGAHNYRLVGLNITAAPSVSQMTSLVNLGDGSSAQNTLAAQPHDIVIDRSYIHGSASLDLRRGVALNSASSAVVNSTISDIHSAASDAQAICGWNGTGPYLIENNDLEASGENVMFGGADPSIPNALPSDITIRGNTFYKPSSWKGVWEVKNLLELKLGQRVLVENNVFNNVWADAQTGFAINIKSTDQDGSAPWANTSNVTIRNNLIENAVSGVSVAAAPDPNPARPTSNVAITGNTFAHIGGGAGAPDGTLFQILGSGGAIDNLTIADNKALTGVDGLNTTVSFDGAPTTHFAFTGNTLMEGAYGFKGSGASPGQGTLQAFAPGAVFAGNTLIGRNAADYGTLASSNAFPATAQNSASLAGPAPTLPTGSNPLVNSAAAAASPENTTGSSGGGLSNAVAVEPAPANELALTGAAPPPNRSTASPAPADTTGSTASATSASIAAPAPANDLNSPSHLLAPDVWNAENGGLAEGHYAPDPFAHDAFACGAIFTGDGNGQTHLWDSDPAGQHPVAVAWEGPIRRT